MPERAPACSPNRSRPRALALGELGPLAGLLEAGLLALLDTRVARQEAAALELAAQVRIGVHQRARDAVAQRPGLGRHAAAVHLGHDVHLGLEADGLERLADLALQALAREVEVELAAVDRIGAVAGLEDHAGDGGLALAGRAVARAGREVDRRVGDRLGQDLVGLLGAELVLVALLVRAQRLLALADDVRLELHARDLGLDARGRLLLDVLDVPLGHGVIALDHDLLGLGLVAARRLGRHDDILGLGLVAARRLGRHDDLLGLGLVAARRLGWRGGPRGPPPRAPPRRGRAR